MDRKFWIIVLAIVAVFEGQLLILQFGHARFLQTELELIQQARTIDHDELREVLYQLGQAREEQRADDVKSFVAGVAAAIASPKKYEEVWHAGYDRGSSVQQYVMQKENEAAYTTEKAAK